MSTKIEELRAILAAHTRDEDWPSVLWILESALTEVKEEALKEVFAAGHEARASFDAAIEAWSDALHMAVGHGNDEEFLRDYIERRIAKLLEERSKL